MNVVSKKVIVALATGLLLASAVAHAVPRPNVFDGGNRWAITFFNDSPSNHAQWATQLVCFLPYGVVGNSIQGAWYSLTFPDWNGRYYQEGDEVKMTGDYANDVGHDHMTLYLTTYERRERFRAMAFKDWTEWREDGEYGRIIGWGNARMIREGRCPIAGHVEDGRKVTVDERKRFELEAEKFSLSLPPRLLDNGEIAELPGARGLESTKTYLERTGLQVK